METQNFFYIPRSWQDGKHLSVFLIKLTLSLILLTCNFFISCPVFPVWYRKHSLILKFNLKTDNSREKTVEIFDNGRDFQKVKIPDSTHRDFQLVFKALSLTSCGRAGFRLQESSLNPRVERFFCIWISCEHNCRYPLLSMKEEM